MERNQGFPITKTQPNFLFGDLITSHVECIFVMLQKWILNLKLPNCQRTSCSKQVQYLKTKQLKWDLNPKQFSKRTMNYLGKLIKCLNVLAVTYLHGIIVCKRVPAPPFLRHSSLDPSCLLFKIFFLLASFPFFYFLRYFRQFPPPSRNSLLP